MNENNSTDPTVPAPLNGVQHEIKLAASRPADHFDEDAPEPALAHTEDALNNALVAKGASTHVVIVPAEASIEAARRFAKASDFEAAIQITERLLAEDPANTEALYIHARASDRLGRHNVAAVEGETLVQLKSTRKACALVLHARFRLKQYGLVIELADKYLLQYENDSRLLLLKARALAAQGLHTEALASAQHAAGSSEHDLAAAGLCFELLARTKSAKEASAFAEAAVRTNPEAETAHALLAASVILQGDLGICRGFAA